MDNSIIEKRKNKIIKTAFWILIIFSLYSILSIFLKYPYKFQIKGFNTPLNPITINLELNKKYNKNIFACFNDYCLNFENNGISNIYSIKFNNEIVGFSDSKIKNLYIAYPDNIEDFENSIINLSLYTGQKTEFYNKNDLLKLKKKHFTMETDGEKENYNAYQLKFKSNYKGYLSHIHNLFLALFYNWQIFIIPYFWLFVAYLIYNFKKEIFNFKLPKNTPYYALSAIIILGIFLRLVGFLEYPLWLDEIYTKTTAIKNFISTFNDPGNPPMFFIFEYIISKIFNSSDLVLRILPLIFSILIIPTTFLLLKDNDPKNTKTAIFGAFFASINTIFIYHAQEARCYSMAMFLSLAVIYFLFKYLKDLKTKNLIIFSILSIMAINTHYILTIFILGNFLWGIFSLLKEKKELLKFLIANILIGLSFLPYLLNIYKTSFNQGFNSWIDELSKNTFLYTINEYFINKYVFLILCIVLFITLIMSFLPDEWLNKINLKKDINKENLFIYLIYSIAFILIISSIISIYIKPILHKRILLAGYGLLFLLEIVSISSIFHFIKENKIYRMLQGIYSIILFMICLSMTHPMPLREMYRLDDFMEFIQNDIKNYPSNYEIHAITNDREDYLDYFPNLKDNNKIIWHYVDTNSMKYLKKISKKDYIKGKYGVVYLHNMSADIEFMSLMNPNMSVYKTNTIKNGKIIYK